jgi:hypothetical protein
MLIYAPNCIASKRGKNSPEVSRGFALGKCESYPFPFSILPLKNMTICTWVLFLLILSVLFLFKFFFPCTWSFSYLVHYWQHSWYLLEVTNFELLERLQDESLKGRILTNGCLYFLMESDWNYILKNLFLLCWVEVHCGIHKSSYNISNISYLNSPPPSFSFISPSFLE